MDAIVAANYTANDREVLIPANHTFNMLPIWANDVTNITITIDGTIKCSKRQHKWPTSTNGKGTTKVKNFIEFEEIHNFTIRGSGTVDG